MILKLGGDILFAGIELIFFLWLQEGIFAIIWHFFSTYVENTKWKYQCDKFVPYYFNLDYIITISTLLNFILNTF